MADGNDKNIQDLKARLGLQKAKAASAPKSEAAPEATSHEATEAADEGQSTPLPGPLPGSDAAAQATRRSPAPQPEFRPPTEVHDVHVDESAAKSGRGAMMLAALFGIALFFGLGYLAGKIFKERSIGNMKIAEAQQVLDWFTKHQVAETGEKTLQTIDEYKGKIVAIAGRIEKARAGAGLDSIREELLEFLSVAASYGGSQVVFDTTGVFRDGWYAAELVPVINAYVGQVSLLHARTQAVAKEASLIVNVQMMQEARASNPQASVRRILVKPTELNGIPWNTGAFLAQVMEPEQVPPQVPEGVDPATIKPEWEVAVLEEGKEKGEKVLTTDVVVVDFSSQLRPLENALQEAALARVAESIVELKATSDLISFDPVKQKLEELAKVEPYFTF